MSAPQECMSWDDCPALAKVTILDILGPRVPILDSMPVVPKTHGYVYLIFFLPLWRRGEKRFAYIGKKSAKANMIYRGEGRRPEFRQALEECAPHECVKVFLGVYPRGRNLSRMEHLIQRKVGIPEAGEGEGDDHPVWLNRFAYGGDKWHHLTREQRSAAGKIGGRVGAQRTAERYRTDSQFRAKMQTARSKAGRTGGVETARRYRTDPQFRAKRKILLRLGGKISGKTNGQKSAERYRTDPEFRARVDAADFAGFWDQWSLPKVDAMRGARRASPRTGRMVVVGVPAAMNPECVRGGLLRAVLALDGCPVDSWLRHYFDNMLTLGSKQPRTVLGIFCNAGFVSIVGDDGRVTMGPGGDDSRLTWAPGRGWRRGKVVSRGPYGWAR